MSARQFQIGMHIEFLDREYCIEERLPNGNLRIRDIAFNESKSVPESELIDALFAGELEFLGNSDITKVERKLVKSFIDDFNRLKDTEPRKVEAIRRIEYLEAIEKAGLTNFSKEAVNPIIENVYREIKDSKRKPYWTTIIYEWRPPWIMSGKDPRSVVPNYKKCGNKRPKFLGVRKPKGEKFTEAEKLRAEEVDGLIKEEIKHLLLLEKPLSIVEIYDRIELRTFDENKFRDPSDQLPIFSERSMYGVIDKLDPYEKDKLKHGKGYADKKFKSNGKGAEYSRPLQREEFDDTRLDLFVIDTETRLPLGRPTLTFGIDCYSGMPVGMHNGFDGPGYLALSECLLHAFQPKTYLKTHFPMVEGDWPVYGLPGEVGVDNGPAYISKDLIYACKQLGVVIEHCPVRCPDAKPFVERFFRTQNERMLHQQPGTSFSGLFDKGDYDPLKNAVISFDALMAMEHLFFVDIYARSLNEGRNNIPINLWNMGVRNYPPSLPRSKNDLRVLLGNIEKRVIDSSGISLFCLDYNSTELSFLRRQMNGDKVTVTYSPKDISIINVWDPIRDKYLAVPSLDQEYTNGLSLWQHNVIKRYSREVLNMQTDKDALRRAKKKIQVIVDREWIKSGRVGTKAKLARWMGVRQPDYNSVLEIKPSQELEDQNKTTSASAPLMLSSGPPPFEGISSHNSLEAQNGTPLDLSEDAQILPIKLELIASSKAAAPKNKDESMKKSKGSSKSDTNQSAMSEDPRVGDATNGSGDEELDLTGFIADYNLPKGEKA